MFLFYIFCGFWQMFVETSGVEAEVEFRNSRLFEVLDRCENTIRIHIQLPLSLNGNISQNLLRDAVLHHSVYS